MADKIAGVVLAGGQSRRFGVPKAFAKKGKKRFYQYSVEALEPFTDTIIIVTNPKLEEFFHQDKKNFAIIKDNKAYQGLGPLAGIYTAMETISADWFMVVPVDVPFINCSVFKILITYLDEKTDAAIPVVSGKIQPLISIFHSEVKELIRNQLDKQELSVQQLLQQCRVKYVPMEEEQPFYNINRQTDYKKWIGNYDEI
ncbi:molybdenum cofactor guanylyltransferase [Oceanobacillus salinisoli]|uniref:molybdenum cofactor guanylyltransferase n=1 Tax=Oceanobacillus salinisoli TaxID=2678611 RepID=UPI0012E2D95E|nr:molybdenum cofactor guanylyltransferase [Oceanobacillus salinisoli]